MRARKPTRVRRGDALRRLGLALLPALAFAGQHAQAATWYVDAGGAQIAFVPATLTIGAGDSVTFINRGGFHNVVADDGSFRCAHGCDDDGAGGNGNASSDFWIATVAFPTPGIHGYFCEPHGAPGSGMFGTIVVLAPTPPATAVPGAGWIACALLIGALLAAASPMLRRLPVRRAVMPQGSRSRD